MTRVAVAAARGAEYREALGARGIEVTDGVAEVVLADPDRMAGLDFSHVRWIQSTWAGVDAVDWERIPTDVLLTSLPGVFGPQIAEFVFAHLLARTQRIPERYSTHSWDTTLPTVIGGSTIGVLGAGSIGAAIARVAREFGMTVRGCRRSGEPDDRYHRMYPISRVAEFADGVDHLVAVLPHTPETEGLIDAALFARLTPGATFVNVGRGATTVTADVVRSVREGVLGLAVLDVTDPEPLPSDHPAWETPGIVVTGHTAAHSLPHVVADFFVTNLERYRAGQSLSGVVDRARGY